MKGLMQKYKKTSPICGKCPIEKSSKYLCHEKVFPSSAD